MNRNNMTLLALAFGSLAAIFFMAPSFGILAKNVGSFLGVVSGVIAAFVWANSVRFSS